MKSISTYLSVMETAFNEASAPQTLLEQIDALKKVLPTSDMESLLEGYSRAFEPSGGLLAPPTETFHTSTTPGHAITRHVEVADVAGFYKAFGVKVAEGSERPDHITAELEFLQLLALKEAQALEDEGGEENASICLNATRSFLKDHLLLWVVPFAEKLENPAVHPFYQALGQLLSDFVLWDASVLGIGDATPQTG